MQVAAGSDHVLFVQVTVMLEVEWVVRAVFGFDKTVVLGACACWAPRESVQARLRLMVKRILRKYKYPPDRQDSAVELVLQQARALGEAVA